MNNLLLLAGMALALAACATTADTGPGSASYKERMAGSSTPTGTLIPRKKSDRSAVNSTEMDKQAFENERMSSGGTNNALGH